MVLRWQLPFLGSNPKREQKPVELEEILYLRTSIHMFLLAIPRIPPTGPQIPLAGPQTPLVGSQIPLAGAQTPLAGPQSLLAGPQSPWAGPQTPPASPQTPQNPQVGPKTLPDCPQSPLAGLWMDRWTDIRMDVQTYKISPYSTGLCPRLGPLSYYSLRLNNSKEAGQGNR